MVKQGRAARDDAGEDGSDADFREVASQLYSRSIAWLNDVDIYG
jgi:hypothetical protein